MKIRVLVICAAVLFPTCLFAAEHQFKNGEAVTVQQDQGYVLVRSFRGPSAIGRGEQFTPLLIRVLSDEEMQQGKALAAQEPKRWKEKIETNVVEPQSDQPYAEKDREEFLLVSLKPGMYVLGGVASISLVTKSKGWMLLSLCMGTVKFEVKHGVITDLGAILVARDDQPTDIPELSKVVSGKPVGFGLAARTMAIRPATADMDVPEKLRPLPIMPADYHAVGVSLNYLGGPIGRLAPLPGVLDYDADGNVIDLRAAGGASQ